MVKEKKLLEEEEETKGGTISDLAKKFLLTGLGAIFMTEESIRNAVSDVKLPKDAMGFVIDQAKKQKDDIISAVAGEVGKFFSKVKVHEEIQKVLTAVQIHVDAKLSFSPKGKAQAKDVKIDVEERDA